MRIALALVAVAVAVGGCSFGDVSGPRTPHHPHGCTMYSPVPYFDLGTALVIDTLGVIAIATAPSSPHPEDEEPAKIMGAGLIGLSLAWWLGSLYGFDRIADCNAAVASEEPEPPPAPVPQNARPVEPSTPPVPDTPAMDAELRANAEAAHARREALIRSLVDQIAVAVGRNECATALRLGKQLESLDPGRDVTFGACAAP